MSRRAHAAGGGYCSEHRAIGDVARLELADWQRTVARIRGEERRRDAERAARRLAARERRR